MLTLSLLALLSAADPSAATPPADEALDFTAEAKLHYRVVACGNDSALPEGLDAKVVDEHCKELNRRVEKYRETWIKEASPFIQGLKPAGLPTTVVYPFGGGDLISALTTYPEAKEITTMSLEHAGDPRRIKGITSKQLKASLQLIRSTSSGLLTANDSKTENLMKGQRGEIPGQLSFFLIALAVHGYEPVSLKYVKTNPDGSLRYLGKTELDTLEKKEAKLLHKVWVAPDFSEAFDNLELVAVKKGGDPQKDRIVHRHFAQNLDDDHFGKDEGMKNYLKARTPICAMTKAASYLLWREAFSTVRDWLLESAVVMVSDSTGIPPRHWTQRGCTVAAYGKFEKSFLGTWEGYQEELRKLFATAKPVPMRFGYPDGSAGKHNHLLLASCPAK